MWSARLVDALLSGLVVGVPFALGCTLLGAPFGAWARLVGAWFGKGPEATPARAVFAGLWRGSLFGAFGFVLGFAPGFALSLAGLPFGLALGLLLAMLLALVCLVPLASIAGWLAFSLERLGSLRSGQAAALAVNVSFLSAPLLAMEADGRPAVVAGVALLALLALGCWALDVRAATPEAPRTEGPSADGRSNEPGQRTRSQPAEQPGEHRDHVRRPGRTP